MVLLKKLLNKIHRLYIYKSYKKNSDSYIQWLRIKGVSVGDNTIVHDPSAITIDVSRPELLRIGSHVYLHKGTTIMTHDWASWCFVEKYNDFIPSHGRVEIGNNVWLGENVTILKGVTVGDNVIIGAGSIVTRSIPSNTVAVGVPAKIVSSLDEYYQKRKEQYKQEAIDYCRTLLKHSDSLDVNRFADDYPLFVDKSNYMKYKFPYSNVFTSDQFELWLKEHSADFHSFEEFVDYCKNYH